MVFTQEKIEATHEEMAQWLHAHLQKMVASGIATEAAKQWATMTLMWLSSGESYLKAKGGAQPCQACKGTGKSVLGEFECTWCKGSGVREGGDETAE